MTDSCTTHLGGSRADGFLQAATWDDFPEAVQHRAAWLLLDFVAVCLAGRRAPSATIALDYAAAGHAGTEATSFVDGRRLTALGAAFANGVLANALDLDDGHNLTKGHPGAVVIPAAIAQAERVGATLRDLLSAIVVGYEVAIRAAIALHARVGEQQASGAWGSIGAAAAAGRLLELADHEFGEALAIASYHAPIAPIMRTVSDPAMTKDATGWGAFVGASAANLAARGFSSTPPSYFSEADMLDLGDHWHLFGIYVKEHPCCRWTQPALRGASDLLATHHFETQEIDEVTVRTFDAAAQLSRRRPSTTDEAQYSVVWPLAALLATGKFDADTVLGHFADQTIWDLTQRIRVVADPYFSKLFPERRVSDVSVTLKGGQILSSGLTEPSGEAADPAWRSIISTKAERYIGLRRLMDEERHAPSLDHTFRPGDGEEALGILARWSAGSLADDDVFGASVCRVRSG